MFGTAKGDADDEEENDAVGPVLSVLLRNLCIRFRGWLRCRPADHSGMDGVESGLRHCFSLYTTLVWCSYVRAPAWYICCGKHHRDM